MAGIKVIFSPTEQKPFLIIYKPKGIPSAPLTQDDTESALSQAATLFPQIKQVTGKKQIEYGLLHRIDTQTDGLLIIAVTQDCYDFLQDAQINGKITKYYTAECEDFRPSSAVYKDSGTITSYFRPFGPGNKEVRPVTEESGTAALKKIGKKKLYTTEYKILSENKEHKTCLVECKIVEGYRHQVRSHLAWIGLPIVGDELYNKKNVGLQPNPTMKFSATKIEFEYPRGDLNSYEIALTWT